jgi:hypothetical protein
MTEHCVDCGEECDVSELDADGRCEFCEWCRCDDADDADDASKPDWPELSENKEDYYF